jgi:hypothetical protein
MKYSKPKSLRFVQKPDGSKWVAVVFNNGTEWLPALDDMATIYSAIGKCEDWKYPNGQGYQMPRDFITDAMEIIHKLNTEKEVRENIARKIEELYREKYDPNGLYRKGRSSSDDLLTDSVDEFWKAQGWN